jgi:hypothetical protein
MATIQELAQNYRDRFMLYVRGEDDVIWTRKDDNDDEALELIAATHDNRNMSPDDYRYEYTVNALDMIIEADEEADEDDLRELEYEIEPDVYYHELNEWLASRTDRYGYVDEAVADFGHGESITDDIAAGQAQEKREVFNTVLEFLAEQADEDEDEDEDEDTALLGWVVVYSGKVITDMEPTDFLTAIGIKKQTEAQMPNATSIKVVPVFEDDE